MNSSANDSQKSISGLTLLAIGVVYGDIGTSPLYAVKETFNPNNGIELSTMSILGGCSIIFWALMIVVSLKYVSLLLSVSNKGEGGIMALLALVNSTLENKPAWRLPILILGLFGAALFFGDAVITPAISVLSAVEGLEIGTTSFKAYVVPITVMILIILFAVQSKGTEIIGKYFGPVCVLWFLTLAINGGFNIAATPEILSALNPKYAYHFLTNHGFASLIVLSAVLLTLTGAEALYADLGHFGKKPIRIAWFGLVLPALIVNYFGQGAFLIAHPESLSNPFYLSFPKWALYPVIILATATTVIASQATISGTYSIAKQAIQLGYLPRMKILHTSANQMGQVYVPAINWILLGVVLVAVVEFGSSSNLAAAYGVAVIGTMFITTILAFFVFYFKCKYNFWLCLLVGTFFILIDLGFLSASVLKIADGGWFSLTLGLIVFTVMLTWYRGHNILLKSLDKKSIELKIFLASLFLYPPTRVKGTAVFLTSSPKLVPHAFLHNLGHNKVVHERIIFLTVAIKNEASISRNEQIQIEPLENECYRILLTFGFKDEIDVPKALMYCKKYGLEFNKLETSYFLSRETVIPSRQNQSIMFYWREQLFAAMTRNARSIVEYFNLPSNRVIELGSQVEI
ncbi:MAG: potassium transporter Kup [Pseudomonadota bacterium]